MMHVLHGQAMCVNMWDIFLLILNKPERMWGRVRERGKLPFVIIFKKSNMHGFKISK